MIFFTMLNIYWYSWLTVLYVIRFLYKNPSVEMKYLLECKFMESLYNDAQR